MAPQIRSGLVANESQPDEVHGRGHTKKHPADTYKRSAKPSIKEKTATAPDQ